MTGQPLRMVDLFSGIGGFSLAGQWAGFDTIQFVEIDAYCQRVLAKNFPGVKIDSDIKSFCGNGLRGTVDLLTGGFPCQDVAGVNRHACGLDGKRSGLWREMFRVIAECQPRYVVIENVSDLRKRGLDIVLKDLSSIGYDAEWHSLRASDCGAPHERERLFVIAYPDNQPELQTDTLFTALGGIGDAWDYAGWGDWRHLPEPDWAVSKPGGARMDAWVSGWVERHRQRTGALGNAIVPQVVYPILLAIAESLRKETA